MNFRARALACSLPTVLAASLLVITPGAAAGGMPSAIGNQSVQWIAVSPAYARTGLVVAMAEPMQGCSQNCVHLWVSHNGGASWSQSPARNWAGGRPEIALDGSGREVLLAATGSALQRSTNDGGDWQILAANGTALPAISPSFATGGTVAVANPQGHDYVFSGGSSHAVAGSAGAYVDLEFMYAPAAGRFAPVLLSAEDGHSQLPVIEQCSAALACSAPTTLTGSSGFSAPAALLPSTAYASDGTVFAQTGRGIYKSTDGGAAFSPLAIVPSNGAEATATPMLALAPGYTEAGPIRTAYAAVFQIFTDPHNAHSGGGVYQSNDGGTTWHPLGSPSPLDGGVFSVAVAPDGRLFAGYTGEANNRVDAGLLCSQDGGRTWQPACSPVGGGSAATTGSSGPAQCATGCAASQGGAAPSAQASPAAGGQGSDGSGGGGGQATGVAAVRGGGGGVPVALVVIAVVVLVLALAALYVRGYLHRRAAASPGR